MRKKYKSHKLSKTRLYNTYYNMQQRCYNPKDPKFSYYGGKGVNICEEWLGENGFFNFYNWAIKNGYADNLEIDRIKNDKAYSPENCRWTDRKTKI